MSRYSSRGSNARRYERSDYPKQLTENFKVGEFDPGNRYGYIVIHDDLARGLQALRNHFGRPIIITSGYRSAAHNESIEGAAQLSYHVTGHAADIKINGVANELVARIALSIFGGVGLYNTHVHVDVGPVRYWVASGVPSSTSSMFVSMAQSRESSWAKQASTFAGAWLGNVGELLNDWVINPVKNTLQTVSSSVVSLGNTVKNSADALERATAGVKLGAYALGPVAAVALVGAVGVRVSGAAPRGWHRPTSYGKRSYKTTNRNTYKPSRYQRDVSKALARGDVSKYHASREKSYSK